MNEGWIGMDIGGTKCAVVLAEVDHGIRIRDRLQFETRTELGFDQAFENLCEGVRTLTARADLPVRRIRGIGVSCGGPLDSRRGVILSPPNLPGWDDIPLTELLESRFGVPAYLQNDANACALVEWKLGAGRGTRDMVFLTMGTGMGAGIIADGRLLCGSGDMAGEAGHFRLAPDGPVGYGKAGSFEGFASGGGMDRIARRQTREMVERGTPPAWIADGHSPEEVNVRLMAEYARRGDARARALFEQAGTRLGEGIALIADMLNPERVVIGSVFARCEDLLRAPMEAALRREALAQTASGLAVVPAQTREQLGDYAAIMVALNALDIDPLEEGPETDEGVLYHYERLFERYPRLEGCRTSVMQAYHMLLDSYRRGGKLMAVGNGGSCADCEHIAGELMKGFYLRRPLPAEAAARIDELSDGLLPGVAARLQQGLPAIALTGHPALSTAVQNDNGPLLAPAQQLIALGRPGDVLLGISTSGNARNVALTVQVARARGIGTIGLTGGDGGHLGVLCDCAIVVPGASPADVQELHLPVYHTLCAMLEARFFGGE